MSSRKKTYQKKAFESTCGSSDVSSNVYESMYLSAAWKDLSKSQWALYQVCKLQYYAEHRKPLSEDEAAARGAIQAECFTMNRAKWCDKYGLYSKSGHKEFQKDMAELINHGFIRCVADGAAQRVKTVYAYSSMWKFWGTEQFKIAAADRTQAMNRGKKAAGVVSSVA